LISTPFYSDLLQVELLSRIGQQNNEVEKLQEELVKVILCFGSAFRRFLYPYPEHEKHAHIMKNIKRHIGIVFNVTKIWMEKN
jgi:hypothetical protein